MLFLTGYPTQLRAQFDNSMPDRAHFDNSMPDIRPSTSFGIFESSHGSNSDFDPKTYRDVGFSRCSSSPDAGSP